LALSTRGKTAVGIAAVAVLAGGGFVGYRLLSGSDVDPTEQAVPPGTANEEAAFCPLTGLQPEDAGNLERRALAVKIENSPEARPQAGLAEADIVYEQEAEGGITRFIVMYQCNDSERLGPVRSARPVDPEVLAQYGDPLFIHAGSVDAVIKRLDEARIEDINCNTDPEPCPRDPNRTAPHDVFTTTEALYEAGGSEGEPPPQAFGYDPEIPQGAKRARRIHLNFSPVADVEWTYNKREGVYTRTHAGEAHTLEDGSPVSTVNVVVMLVEREDTRIVDSAGTPVPTYDVVGEGDLLVFRDGKVIEGTWSRDTIRDVTEYLGRDGEPIPLRAGTTWIELFPTDAPEEPEF
jgi:hypothetical protein